MSHSTLGTASILSGQVTLPRSGVWHAELDIDAPTAPAPGATVLQIGAALKLRGTITQSGIFSGRVRVRVCGGAGTLSRELAPRWYEGAPLSLPLRDLVEEAGERLSAACDPDLVAIVLDPGWSRLPGPAGESLGRLLDETGATWRVLPDGSIWAGPETWPASTGMADVLVLESHGGEGRKAIVTETPTLLPGQTFQGTKVALVQYTIGEDKLRAEVWAERQTPGLVDRAKAGFLRIVESLIARRTRYLRPELGTVVSQDGAGRLDVRFDDDHLPPLTGVPIRMPTPGMTVTVSPGAKVLVTFQAGDPRRPIATWWESGELRTLKVSASELVQLDPAGLPAGRQGDMVMSGGPTTFIILGAPGGVGPAPLGVPLPVFWTDPTHGIPPTPILFGTLSSGNPRVKV
jgi:hypothetical protein